MKRYFIMNLLILGLTVLLITGTFFVLVIYNTSIAAEDTTNETKDTIPPSLSNIQIENITATSSVINWETDELSDSLVNYGLNKNYGIVRDPRFDKIKHTIILEELAPGTNYYFRITSSDASGNQGISNDYSFTTPAVEKPQKEGYAENVSEAGKGGLSEKVLEEGKGGLSEKGLEEIIQFIKSTTNEEVLEKIQEEVQSKAEEIIKPPTIILDYADVEVGTDYAIITWETDKESNTIVSLAKEADYKPDAENPYIWNEGQSEEMVMEHRVEITGLAPSTIYHFQVSSKSDIGLTGKSTDKTFKTKAVKPEIYNVQITKIEETSATIKFTTNIPCSSIINYTNLTTNVTKLEGDSTFLTMHTMRLSNLIFDTYYSAVINVTSEDNEKAESNPMTFITIRDQLPPVVSKVNTESTLYPGSDNKIQTIISWASDEPAKCQLFYHQGVVVVGDPLNIPKEDDYTVKHVQVVTNFLPATVYKFWVVCEDSAVNKAKSEDFIMLTPTREESIIDIILKNFESSFGWVKKVGG